MNKYVAGYHGSEICERDTMKIICRPELLKRLNYSLELEFSLKDSYEALLLARKLLADADISVIGGRIQAAIESAALTLYPPSAKAIDMVVNAANQFPTA